MAQTKWHGEAVSDLHWQFICSRTDTQDEGRCWAWTGAIDTGGYSRMKADGIWVGAHRVAWAYANGVIEPGLVIDHLCRNRRCVNPAHLELVNDKVNVAVRSVSPSALNAQKEFCIRGHLYTPENTFLRPSESSSNRNCKMCRNVRKRMRTRKGLVAVTAEGLLAA